MLSKVNYPLVSMLVFGLRLVVKGAGVGEAVALAALCALYGFTLFLDSKKEIPVNDAIKSELSILRDTVNSLKLAKSMGRL